MSSWVIDFWDRALIPQANGTRAVARTQCKLGGHLILGGVPTVWLRGPGVPLGLSCLDCARPVRPDDVAAEEARQRPTTTAAPKKAASGGKVWEHGKTYTYQKMPCRCPECRRANSEANARYRARRQERQS